MTTADFKSFTMEFTLLAEVFSEALSATRIHAYFIALEDLPLEQLVTAMRTAQGHLRFFPKPVELRELVHGSPDERAEMAWTRVRQAFMHGLGGYRPIDFGEPILHATVDAMGGWARFFYLGFRGVEEVEIVTTRKEFLVVYRSYLMRRTPGASTPVALCADRDPVFPESQRLGDGFNEAVVPMLPAAQARRALAAPAELIGPEAVRELLSKLAAHHRRREPTRRHQKLPANTAPSAADLEAHEAKKAAVLRGLSANGSSPAMARELSTPETPGLSPMAAALQGATTA